MKSVPAVLLEGDGVASGRSPTDRRFPLGTIKLQQPFFKKLGLDLEQYFDGDFVSGTLNLSIAPLVYEIKTPEYVFRGVRWTDVFPPENFFLSPARVVYRRRSYRALLYIPDPSTKPDHFKDPSTIEVIAQEIPGIRYGDNLTLRYSSAISTK